MITSNGGKVRLKGDTIEVLGDFAAITEALKDDYTKEQLQDAFELAYMSDEEILNGIIEKIMERLGD